MIVVMHSDVIVVKFNNSDGVVTSVVEEWSIENWQNSQ